MMDDSFAFVFLPAFDLLLEGAWKQFRPVIMSQLIGL